MKLVKAREAEFKFNTGPEVLTITLEGIVVDDLLAQTLEARLPVIIEDVEMVKHEITQEDLDINPGLEEEVTIGDEVEIPVISTDETLVEETPVVEEAPKKKVAKTNKK